MQLLQEWIEMHVVLLRVQGNWLWYATQNNLDENVKDQLDPSEDTDIDILQSWEINDECM